VRGSRGRRLRRSAERLAGLSQPLGLHSQEVGPFDKVGGSGEERPAVALRVHGVAVPGRQLGEVDDVEPTHPAPHRCPVLRLSPEATLTPTWPDARVPGNEFRSSPASRRDAACVQVTTSVAGLGNACPRLNGERLLDMAEPDGATWGHKCPDPTAWSECCAHYAALLVAAKEAVADSRNARHLATLRRELWRRQSDPETPRSV